MKWFRRIALGVVAIVAIAFGALFATGNMALVRLDVFGLPNITNYHLLDYPLFHMDIRENAILRVRTYLQSYLERTTRRD